MSGCRVISMNTNKLEIIKMTKKNMIAHIEERFNKMDWFIAHHQENATKNQLKADEILEKSYEEYRDSKEKLNARIHRNLVEEYKAKKDLLNEILTEITGNFYGGKENK